MGYLLCGWCGFAGFSVIAFDWLGVCLCLSCVEGIVLDLLVMVMCGLGFSGFVLIVSVLIVFNLCCLLLGVFISVWWLGCLC